MFTSDHEYSAYKTAELEGAINDALAERRAVIPAGEKAGSSPDSSVMLEIQAQAKPLTLWIDKVITARNKRRESGDHCG